MDNNPLAALYHNAEDEKKRLQEAIRKSWKEADWQRYDYKQLDKAAEQKRRQMLAAAKELDFSTAAMLRDELLEMENKLQAMRG